MKKILLALCTLVCLFTASVHSQDVQPPLRFAMVGLTHDHAYGFLAGLASRHDAQLAGIVETNPVLIARYSQKFNLDTNLFFPSLEALLARTNISAVATFTSTYEHAQVVEKCAALGIGVVMMEKPLAVNMREARKIEAAVKKSGLQIIVNYETTWYPGNQKAYTMIHDENQIGNPWRFVFHTGHQGPKEIGCSTNFLAWLTDPVLNGGGAINDFGCYGADLATWFMDGKAPTSVFAVARQLKPEIYPKVEDDATIVLTYPKTEVIIQASWNWPFNVKDMDVYGKTGYVLVPVPTKMRVRTGSNNSVETEMTPPALTGAHTDSVSYLSAVVRKEIQPAGLSSLAVNMVVVEILDAAHKSARTGRRVDL
jgi:predicted dehydrogenase